MASFITKRRSELRARLLEAARRWEEDAAAEDARIGAALAEYGCGKGDLMRRVAAGFREMASNAV